MRAIATSPRRRRASTGGFPSFGLLKLLSFAASAIYAGLLLLWLGPDAPAVKTVLGWSHGLLWIALSLLALVAVRRGTIPFWLAVTVAVVGGVGPFAGTLGFLVESRRRRHVSSSVQRTSPRKQIAIVKRQDASGHDDPGRDAPDGRLRRRGHDSGVA
jgi:hypothetical protein